MSKQEFKVLLSTIFQYIESAKVAETNKNVPEAINFYMHAVNLLSMSLTLEQNPQTVSLLNEQINTYRSEINRLENRVSRSSGSLSQPKLPSSAPSRGLSGSAEADLAFAAALDIDEKSRGQGSSEAIQTCIDAYLSSVDMYMRSPKDEAATKRKRIAQILDRVEALRIAINPHLVTSSSDLSDILPEAPTSLTVATVSSTKGAASDTPAPTIPLAGPGASAGQAWQGASKKLSTADVIPTAAAIAAGGSGLTQLEIQVLRASSVVNGRVFQPWLPGEEEREKFRYDHPFCDPDGLLPLSAQQIAAGAEWRRPREFILGDAKPTMIELISPLSIRQDLVSDCSFVCSLCIASAFEAKFRKQLITSIIYPQNASHKPIYNAYGKYLVKLFINGVQRKVVVDDRLPVNAATGELLCSASSDPKELWVSIIEKAYMKINGGYDFPGSNSGIDLYALTGWIPESVYFSEDATSYARRIVADSGDQMQDHRQGEDRAWERIKSAHGFGDCLVTISTGTLTSEEESATGLVPGHAYAVLDVKEAGTLRMLRVKNPWSKRPWRGRFSSADRTSWTEGLKNCLGVQDKDFDKMETHGLFWIEFDDCRRYFKSFHLNWNPALFAYRTVFHDFWKSDLGPKNDRYFIGDNPQYCVVVDLKKARTTGAAATSGVDSAPTTSTFWILLSRHVVQKESKETVMNAESRDNKDGDFLALHVYRLKSTKRLYCNTLPSVKGLYTNNHHILVRVDVDNVPLASCETEGAAAKDTKNEEDQSEEVAFTLVLSQIDKSRDVCYTLNVLGTVPFRFYPAPKPPTNKLELPGAWTTATCGGPPSCSSFYQNPQYRILIGGSHPVLVHFQIVYPKEISAAIYLCRGGNRLDGVPEELEVASSGVYRAGYSYVEASLKPGPYTVILSTFTNEMLGRYMASLQTSSTAVGAAEIAQEGQSGFRMAIRGAWQMDNGTAAGCNNFGNYNRNPIYVFSLTAPSRITVRLRRVKDFSTAALNISLYLLRDASGAAVGSFCDPSGLLSARATPKKATFTSNAGVYTDRPTGVVLDSCELAPGQWAMVPSTYDPSEEQFDIFVSFSVVTPISIQRVQ